MRGAKRDISITKLLYDNGLLLDKRSFVSLGAEPHLFLKGEDVSKQRERVWERAHGRCEKCKKSFFASWDFNLGEMDHKQGGLVGRCDCLDNLQALCGPCHRAKHVQVQLKSIPIERCQERHAETGQCELRVGHERKHLAGYMMWGDP